MSDQPKEGAGNARSDAHEKVSFSRRDRFSASQFPSSQGARTLNAQPRKRSVVAHILKLFLALGLLLAIAVGIGFALLTKGISNAQITERLLKEVSQYLGEEYQITSDTGVIRLVSGQLVFQFQGIEFLNQQQQKATLERINLGLNAEAMIKRQVEITSLALDGITIIESQKPQTIALPQNPDVIAQTIEANLLRVISTMNKAGLPQVHIRNVQLLPNVSIPNLTIDKTASSEFIVGGEALIFNQILALNGIAAIQNNRPEIDISLQGFDLTALNYREGRECGGVVGASFRSNPEGQAYRSALAINWQDGFCTHPKAGPVDLNASTEVRIQSDSNFYNIAELSVKAGQSMFTFDGGFESGALTAENGDEFDIRFELISDMSTAHSEISNEQPVNFAAKIGGYYSFSEKTLDFKNIDIRTPSGGEATGEALLSFTGQGAPALFTALTAKDFMVAEAKQLWPYFAAKGGREWAHRAVFGGTVKNADLEMTVPAGILGNGVPLGPDYIRGNADIVNTRFDLVSELPAVREASGRIEFAGTNVTANLSTGKAYLDNDRRINLETARLTLNDAHIKPAIARVQAKVNAAMPALVDFANRNPINASKGFPISPKDVTGKSRADVNLAFSVNATGPKAKPVYDAVINFNDLDFKKPIRGRSLSGLDGRIAIKDQFASIQMTGVVDGLRATFDIEEPIGKNSTRSRKQDVTLALNSNAIKKLSPELARYLSGSVTAKVKSVNGRTEIDANLKDATIVFDAVGIRKKKGQSGRARFTLDQGGGTTRISNFRLDGNSLSGQGNIVIGKQGLQSAKLTNVAFPGAKNFSVDVGRGNSGLQITLKGDEYDARDLLKRYSNLEGNADGSKASFQIRADVRRVQGLEKQQMSSLKLALQNRNGKSNIDVVGTIGSGKSVRLIRNNLGNNRRLAIQSDDAGALLKFAGLYSKMTGGTLSANLNGIAGNAYQGPISLINFEVRDEPKLKALLSGGGERSLNSVTKNRLRSDRIKFRQAKGQVLYSKNFLTIRDGLIGGQEVGLTLEGVVYDERKNMNLTGTFLPAYGLNRMIGGIPILGQLLGNGEKTGLIGITFKLEGAFRNPRIFVNPLSLVAPGIFREIFRF